MSDLTVTPTDQLINMMREVFRQEMQAITPSKTHEAPLDKKSLSEYLGISISTLEKIMKSGEIQYFNIGNQPRFTWSQIETYENKKISK